RRRGVRRAEPRHRAALPGVSGRFGDARADAPLWRGRAARASVPLGCGEGLRGSHTMNACVRASRAAPAAPDGQAPGPPGPRPSMTATELSRWTSTLVPSDVVTVTSYPLPWSSVVTAP